MKKSWLYAHLSWPEIRALDKDNLVVIQPLAAIEDHGHHLPVETDNLLIWASQGDGRPVRACTTT